MIWQKHFLEIFWVKIISILCLYSALELKKHFCRSCYDFHLVNVNAGTSSRTSDFVFSLRVFCPDPELFCFTHSSFSRRNLLSLELTSTHSA